MAYWDFNTAGKQPGDGGGDRGGGADWEAISEALRDLAYRWAPELYPAGRIADGKLRLGDITGRAPRNNGSCVIHLSGEHAGEWFEYDIGKGGGPVSTVKEACGLSGEALADYCRELILRHGGAGYLDRPRRAVARTTESEDAGRERKRHEAMLTWDQAVPYLGTLAEVYLRARGITAPPPCGDLRFHDNCTHFATLRGVPALIARLRSPEGTEVAGIHRTYLLDDGSWHIGGDKSKMALGESGFVFLGWPNANGCMGIAEGIETAAAAAELYGVPGIAAVGTDGMRRKFADYLRSSWTAAHPLRSLLIWSDKGKAGGEAAAILNAAATAVGLPSRICYPQGEDDFADDLKRGLRPPPPGAVPQAEPEIIPPPRPRMSAEAVRMNVNALKRMTPVPELRELAQSIAEVITDRDEVTQLVSTINYKTRMPAKTIRDFMRGDISADKPAGSKASRPWLDDKEIMTFESGEVRPIMANIAFGLRKDPEWEGVLAFNEFSGMISLLRNPPYDKHAPGAPCERVWTDDDELAATEWFQKAGVFAQSNIVYSAIARVASETKFNPVRDYLDYLAWDGVPRIDGWLQSYLGVDDSQYARAVGSRFLIGCVARIYEPGCKLDTALILEGEQGIRKSGALKALSEPWFTDQIEDIGSKDAALQMRGVWILEFAELDSVQRADVAKLKAFMTQTKDRFRPPWGRQLVDWPRSCAFAGTVNENAYLRDATGGRRFWPVLCKYVLLDELRRDRDQLWAEAVARYLQKEMFWLHETTLIEAAKEEQEARYQADVWEDVIADWLRRNPRDVLTVGEVIENALLIQDRGKWGKSEQTRVGLALRRLGWESREERVIGTTNKIRRYRRKL